ARRMRLRDFPQTVAVGTQTQQCHGISLTTRNPVEELAAKGPARAARMSHVAIGSVNDPPIATAELPSNVHSATLPNTLTTPSSFGAPDVTGTVSRPRLTPATCTSQLRFGSGRPARATRSHSVRVGSR